MVTEVVPGVFVGSVEDVAAAADAGCTYILSVCAGGIGEGKALPKGVTHHMKVEVSHPQMQHTAWRLLTRRKRGCGGCKRITGSAWH